jgi:hypothetical protein
MVERKVSEARVFLSFPKPAVKILTTLSSSRRLNSTFRYEILLPEGPLLDKVT